MNSAESIPMNKFQKIAIATGIVFIIFIFLVALANFNSVVMVLGFIGVIAVISGTVKVILLAEKRKDLQKELQEFREQRLEDMKRKTRGGKTQYSCPECFYKSGRPVTVCPACGYGKQQKAE